MMISCDDAPSLENALHRELHKQRVNKVNFRKEFFRGIFRLDTKNRNVATWRGRVSRGTGGTPVPESISMPDEILTLLRIRWSPSWGTPMPLLATRNSVFVRNDMARFRSRPIRFSMAGNSLARAYILGRPKEGTQGSRHTGDKGGQRGRKS